MYGRRGTAALARDRGAEARPRERLAALGAAALADEELLALVLGTGIRGEGVVAVAERLLGEGGAEGLRARTYAALCGERGVGEARAARMVAALELGRRAHGSDRAPLVRTPDEVYAATREYALERREHFLTVLLNARNRLIRKELVSIGTLNASLVHPREVFRSAILESAASLILVHNHPSDDPQPSADDLDITTRIQRAGEILGIELLDHVIVCRSGFLSFRQEKML
jgi:DNA repair protein RadC